MSGDTRDPGRVRLCAGARGEGDTVTTSRILWCPKSPDGELRLSMLGATMWLAWGRLEEASGYDLHDLQRRGWKVVRVNVQEMAS